ncbi:MAG: hypothetical protein V1647_05755 [Pseudomonadota bacterium]
MKGFLTSLFLCVLVLSGCGNTQSVYDIKIIDPKSPDVYLKTESGEKIYITQNGKPVENKIKFLNIESQPYAKTRIKLSLVPLELECGPERNVKAYIIEDSDFAISGHFEMSTCERKEEDNKTIMSVEIDTPKTLPFIGSKVINAEINNKDSSMYCSSSVQEQSVILTSSETGQDFDIKVTSNYLCRPWETKSKKEMRIWYQYVNSEIVFMDPASKNPLVSFKTKSITDPGDNKSAIPYF